MVKNMESRDFLPRHVPIKESYNLPNNEVIDRHRSKPAKLPPLKTCVSRDITVKCKLYYSLHVLEEEGFYPVVQKQPDYVHVIIVFQLKQNPLNYWWEQLNGSVIYGFNSQNGEKILNTLNKVAGITATKIYNSGGRCVHPITYAESTYYLINQQDDCCIVYKPLKGYR